jgi:hypothetical protein
MGKEGKKGRYGFRRVSTTIVSSGAFRDLPQYKDSWLVSMRKNTGYRARWGADPQEVDKNPAWAARVRPFHEGKGGETAYLAAFSITFFAFDT